MNRFSNLSAAVLTVCVHLVLCAVMACVGFLDQASFAQPLAPAVGHTLAPGMAVVSVASTGGVADAAPDTPAGESASERLTADPASDLPELLLTTATVTALAPLAYRQVAFKLYPLPHPFAERPQRPPQIDSARV